MKVAVSEVEDWQQKAFGALKADHEVEFAAEKLSGENASTYSKAEIISTFIYSGLDRQILAEFEHLKLKTRY